MKAQKRFWLMVLIVMAVAVCEGVDYQATYSAGDLSFDMDRTNVYDMIMLDGLGLTNDPGMPQLPVEYVTLIIPANMEIGNITVSSSSQAITGSYWVYPGQGITSPSDDPGPFVEPDSVVYTTNAQYPDPIVEVAGYGFFDGNAHLATLAIQPLQYNPVTMSLELTTSISIDLTFTPANTNPVYPAVRRAETQARVTDALTNMVANPQDISSRYTTPMPDQSAEDMVIVCPVELESALEDFVLWKRSKGLNVVVETLEDIYTQYPNGDQVIPGGLGIDDDAGSTRQYLYSMYLTNGVYYALLVGDDSICPIRQGFYNDELFWDEDFIIADLYYADYNGDWNADNDERYGEKHEENSGDAPDMYADIMIGRLLVEGGATGQEQIANWTEKLLTYETNPGYGDDDYLTRAVFTSSDQFVFQEGTAAIIEQAIYNLSRLGFDNIHLIEDPPEGVLGLPTGNQVIAAINEGTGIIGLNNHGHVEVAWVATESSGTSPVQAIASFNNYDLLDVYIVNESSNGFDNLKANGKYPILHSSCCHVAGFDLEVDTMCMARAFTTAMPDRGGPAFLGNTREGYFNPSTNRERLFCEHLAVFNNKNIGLLHASSQAVTNPCHRVTYALNLFGDPEMEVWTAAPLDLDVAFDFTNRSITVTSDGSPMEGAVVVFTSAGGATTTQTTTDATGVASCAYDYQTVCVTQYGYKPNMHRIGLPNETISSDTELKWDMIIPTGRTVTIDNSTLTLSSFGGRNATITVEDGATLTIGNGVTIEGEAATFIPTAGSDIQVEIPGNSIEVYGDLMFTGAPMFFSSVGWDGIHLITANCVCTGGVFIKTPLVLDEHSSFAGDDLSFTDSPINVDTSDLELDECELLNSPISGFYYDPGPFQQQRHINITDSDLSDSMEDPAVLLTNYPDFEFAGNTISDNSIGLYIEESGLSGPRLIEDNIIEDNSLAGVVLYHSYVELSGHNVIRNNNRGMIVYHDTNWEMIGDNAYPMQTVYGNTHEEILFAYNSAPTGATFYFNQISDTDVNHEYALMKCYTTPSSVIDVADNSWGTLFSPSLDLFPEGLYAYQPIWVPGNPRSTSFDDEELYDMAQQYENDESYLLAKSTYEDLIEEYPSSKFAKLSASALLALEKQLGSNYEDLQAYYASICTDSLDAELTRVCDYLDNYCNLEIGEYETAIEWFEAVIDDAPTLEDSVYAVIDAGFTYLLMMENEEGGDRGAYTGRMAWLRPESQSAHEKRKAELLALLWGDSEGEGQDIPAVVSMTQNYPNPFNPTTMIKFSIPDEARVKLTIYNIRGQRVVSLLEDTLPSGFHEVVWNGKDATGRTVSSGVYFYRLETGDRTLTKKMLLLK
ncbi:MAG: T9SS type A sorting domain-containing protein [Candidatus Cloacimonetes bacterium]|nr:T9SS type A sorting domain-containing protein [Candidatus Cloacimonadota bacterium]